MTELRVSTTTIPGLLVLTLPVHRDKRGWFKENWQRAKMLALGLPDFAPVQNNVSFNVEAGVTRGMHAEPWDKLVSVAAGRAFGAWVDLRAGPSFGRVHTAELGPETAVFVPRGVANGFQALAAHTSYSYLVNEHWSDSARDSYSSVHVADPQLGIPWPMGLGDARLSEADRAHPALSEVAPLPARRLLILGANGQLGRALSRRHPEAAALDRAQLDLTNAAALNGVEWGRYDVVVNAAAYTAVDAAETPDGRREAWATNVHAVARLCELARHHRFTLVHLSSDYVFDGTKPVHREDEPFSPLGVYGQTKAAGDLCVSSLPRHYLVRTSWVVGDGRNFVATMAALADAGVDPAVVNDQTGRLTFTDDLASAIDHLLTTAAPFGTYNVSNEGPPTSWAEVADTVLAARGRDPSSVRRVDTAQYNAGRHTAPRPPCSTLSLEKIRATGFIPRDGHTALIEYLTRGRHPQG